MEGLFENAKGAFGKLTTTLSDTAQQGGTRANKRYRKRKMGGMHMSKVDGYSHMNKMGGSSHKRKMGGSSHKRKMGGSSHKRKIGGGSIAATAALPFGLFALQKFFQTQKGRKDLSRYKKSSGTRRKNRR